MPSRLLLLLRLLPPPSAPIAFSPRRRPKTASGSNRSSDGIASPTTLRLLPMLLPCLTLVVSPRPTGDVTVPVTLPFSRPATLLALGSLTRPARWSPGQTAALAAHTARSVLRFFLVSPVAALFLDMSAVAPAPTGDIVVAAAIASVRVRRRRRVGGLRALPTPFTQLHLPCVGASWAPRSPPPSVPAAVLESTRTGRWTSAGSDGGRHQTKV